MNNIFLDLFEPQIQERERIAAANAFTTFTERMIREGISGPVIARMTGYDRSRIDSIAQRLNRDVQWNEAGV